jgi:hypothetical protein
MANPTKLFKSIGTESPSSNKRRLAISVVVVATIGMVAVAAIKLSPGRSGNASEPVSHSPMEEGGQLAIKLSAEKLRTAQLHVTTCQTTSA